MLIIVWICLGVSYVQLLPGENIAGARPAMASCLFLVKSEIFQTKTPSYVAADNSLIFPSISMMDRSLRLTVLSSCRTCSSAIRQ